jgi:hypothetical protein
MCVVVFLFGSAVRFTLYFVLLQEGDDKDGDEEDDG